MIAVTCITNGYADLAENVSGIESVCFSDRVANHKLRGWDIKQLDPFFHCPRRNSRLPKILMHRFVETDVSIWHDASFQLLDPQALVGHLGDADIAMFRNHRRKSLADEFEAIRKSKWSTKGMVDQELLNEQEKQRVWSNTVVHYGGAIVRRHNAKTASFNESWFREYCLWQERDQPSMHGFLANLKVTTIPGDIKNNKMVRWLK